MAYKICIILIFLISSLFAKEPIKIVYNSGTPPLKFTDKNSPTGMLIDIWKLWAKKNNIDIKFIEASWDDTINMIKSGEADIHAGIYYTKERDEFLDYTSKPLYENNRYFFYNKSLGDIKDKNELKPYVIGIDNGFAVDFMKKNYKDFFIKEYESSHEVDNAFFNGQLKVILASLPTFFYDLKVYGHDTNDFSYSKNTYAYSKRYFGAVKQGNKELLNIIDKGFEKISKKEIENIELKWTKNLDLNLLNKKDTQELFTKENKNYLDNKKIIRMCVDPAWLPFESIKDGKHIGIIADIFKLFGKKLTIPIELQVTDTWAQTLEYAKSRKCDIIGAAAETTNRREYMNFSKSYLMFPQVLVTREKEPFISDFNDVIYKKIGIVKNSAIEELIRRKYPEINLVETTNVDEGLFKVSSGELYGFVNTTAAVNYGMKLNGLTDLKIASKVGIDYFLKVAIRNDEPELLDIFNKIILQTKTSEIKKIEDKWLTIKMDEIVNYTILYKYFGIFIIVVAFILYWNRKLHKEIDERKIVEEELNKFLQVIKQSQISVVLTNKNGIIEYINPYALEKTGYEVNEVLGENPRIFKSGNQDIDFYKNLWETILSGKTWSGEFSNKKKNGEFFWESAIIAPIFDDEKQIKYFVAIKEDITEDKRLQKELAHAQEEAQIANKAKSDFLAKMSHEIRTPMNAVLGMLYLLEKTPLTNIQEDYIKKANGAANSLLGVINDILDFSKIEANKLEIKNNEFDIQSLIRDIMGIMSVKAEENNLELLAFYDKDFPIKVYSDSLRISQILNNLLSNAIKFSNGGEILVSTKLIDKKDDEATLMISVKDSGIGISVENQKKLFQEFSQVDDSATRSFHGTGLGLAICKKLSELLGGTIWVERSEEGVGTTISFTIRAKILTNNTSEDFDFSELLSNLKVLVVDDNLIAADVLSKMLQSFNYKVDIVYNGNDAIDSIEKNNYDLVFLDYKMPKLNGLETFVKYKEKLKDNSPKTILVTAYSQELLGIDIQKYGILSYMTKPVTPSTLYDNIVETMSSTFTSSLKKSKKNKIKLEKLKNELILLVEDNKLNQEFVIPLLESYGLSVEVANDGFEAIDKIKTKKYSLVLMDIQMPKLDGLEASRRIRAMDDKYFKQIPIIALSANALVGDEEKSLEAGMNEHLTKPINPKKLFSTLKKFIEEVEPIEIEQEECLIVKKIDSGIFDIDAVMNRMSNNEKAYLKILNQFYSKYVNVFDYIDELIKNKDINELEKKVHELKGVSGNIGAKDLFSDLSKINTILINDKLPNKKLFDECKINLEKVLNEIKKLEKNTEEKSKKFDKNVVIHLLTEIRNNLNIDIVVCEENLEKLMPYLNNKYNEFSHDLDNALNEFDTDKVDELINKFLKELDNEFKA